MKNNKTAHIIGICGAGLSAVAVLLKEAGYKVTGSDEGFYEPIAGYLKKNKISFFGKHSAKNIPKKVDMVVVGKHAGLTPEENPETREALRRGLKIKSFPEVLNMLSERTENLIVVGSYGKSSVTTLLSWCLSQSKKDPSYFIGALPIDLKNSSHLGRGKEFVLEGDEYPATSDKNISKFLYLNPRSVLLISAEHDHVNIFPTEKSYVAPYKKLVAKIPEEGTLVYSVGGKNNKEVAQNANCKKLSYGLNNTADWYPQNIKYGKITSFDLVRKGENIIRISTPLLGDHNIENIVGVGALLLEEKRITPAEFSKAIQDFHGLKRRLELINKNPFISIYEDFGSSYGKAKAGFQAFKKHFPKKRIVVVFEPHSFSWRNKKFLNWYKTIFEGLDEVILLPAPSHGQKAKDQLHTEEVWDYAKKYFPLHTANTEKEALSVLKKNIKKGDVIVLVSSGSLLGLTKSVPKLVDSLTKK